MEALLDHHSRTLDLLGDAAFAGAARLIESLYECWDGTGGPQGLAGRAIPFGARILAVADVSDEARARCLRVDQETQQAVVQAALLYEGGKRLDPDLVRVSLHASDGQLCS
jgi:response regulator RpfG family c-di-GMP phosphodiesterase